MSGSASLSAEVTTIWGGLYLRSNAPIDLTPYSELRFWARATAPGQSYWIYLTGTDDQQLGNALQLSAIAGDPPPSAWTEYRIPLDASGFNIGAAPIHALILQDFSGSAHPPVFLDDVVFVAAGTPVPPAEATLTLALSITNDDGGTATPVNVTLRVDGTPTPASVAQTLPIGAHTVSVDALAGYTLTIGGACTPAGAVSLATSDALTCAILADDLPASPTGLIIYDDALNAGWANWSWNADVDFANPAPVLSGSASLSVEVTTIWGGLYLRSNTPVDISAFTELRFWAQATAPGQIY